ncbi:MAG: histidine kinase N-terminal 7TM domain-containing protein [Thermoplasmatota archaeon]
MGFGLVSYLALLAISAFIPLLLIIILLHKEKGRKQYIFSVMMACISIWSIFYFLEIFVDSYMWMSIFTRLRFIGIAFLPVFWLGFSLYYTGRENWLKGNRLLFLSVLPIFTQLMIWLNDYFNLFWGSEELVSIGEFEVLFGTAGPWFWIHTIYSYGLVLIGIILILNFLMKIGDMYIKEALILFVGVATPLFGNSIYILELGVVPKAYDITPITFLVTSIIFTWAVIKLEFLKIKPVARDTIFRNIDDHIFIIDNDNMIVDCNESVLSLVNDDGSGTGIDIIGSNIDEVLDREQLEGVKNSDKSSLMRWNCSWMGKEDFLI